MVWVWWYSFIFIMIYFATESSAVLGCWSHFIIFSNVLHYYLFLGVIWMHALTYNLSKTAFRRFLCSFFFHVGPLIEFTSCSLVGKKCFNTLKHLICLKFFYFTKKSKLWYIFIVPIFTVQCSSLWNVSPTTKAE